MFRLVPIINGGNLEREPVRVLFTETRRQESHFLSGCRTDSDKQVRVRLKFKLLYKKRTICNRQKQKPKGKQEIKHKQKVRFVLDG